MISSNSVILLTDASTYPLLLQALLNRDDVHPSSSASRSVSSHQEPSTSERGVSATSRTKEEQKVPHPEQEVLRYTIDNKYYTAEISLHIFCLDGHSRPTPSSPSAGPSFDNSSSSTIEGSNEDTHATTTSGPSSDTLSEFRALCDPADGAQAFIWVFSDESLGSEVLYDLPKPRPEHLDLIREHQKSRELNYALCLALRPETAGRVRNSEIFDDQDWEVVVHAPESRTVSSIGLGRSKEDEGEGDADGAGLEVIFESLQTVMWEGMKRKPRLPAGTSNRQMEAEERKTPNRTEQEAPNSGSEKGDDVRRQQVMDRDRADTAAMEGDLEAWLNDATDTVSRPFTAPVVSDVNGFEDDFGPFRSSASGDGLQLDPDLDLDQEVNLEAILDQLNRTREELGMVENEDERRVRAGKEVGRLLGIIGLDLEDDDEDGDHGERDGSEAMFK